MSETYMFIFTRSAEPNEPSLFCSSLKEILPNTLPKTFGVAENEPFQFEKVNFPRFVDFWWSGTLFWESTKPSIYGSAFLGNEYEHTDIFHRFTTKLASAEACRQFMIEFCKGAKADYAFLHVLPSKVSEIRPEDEMLSGATSRELHQWLPGIPWAACYGEPYIELFGKKNLLSLPIHDAKEIQPKLVYCQLTDRLLDTVDNTSLIDERRNAVYDCLGREAFFDPLNPEQHGRAPVFQKPIVVRNPHDPERN